MILPFVYGGFYDWTFMIAGVMWAVLLMWTLLEKQRMIIDARKMIIGMIVFICYLGTISYGIDRGMSMIGAVKVLTILVFAVLIRQLDMDVQKDFLNQIPMLATIMTITSMITWITPIKTYFFQAGRLGGFFQYSNTFALYLLLAFIILCYKQQWEKKEYIEMFILTAGILATGSRIVFILWICNLLYFVLKRKEKRKIFLCLILFVIALTMIGVIVSGSYQNTGRYLTIFTSNSTLWGRIIYAADGIKILLKHPLGTGYMGYYYLQPSMQSAAYITRFVHNDLLQIGLDAGIFPMILVVIWIIKELAGNQISKIQKHLLIIMGVHSLFDFNLQFLAVSTLFILCMKTTEENRNMVEDKKIFSVVGGITAISMIIFIWLGSSLILEQMGKYEQAQKVMPWLTSAKIMQLSKETQVEKAQQLADDLIRENGKIAQAYGIKAEIEYEQKDYDAMIKNKRLQIENQKYSRLYYEDYIKKLSVILSEEQEAGNTKEMSKYLKELLWISDKIKQVNDQTSKIAVHLKDDSKVELEENYQTYLEQIKEYYIQHY